jgi:hypothetical protein
MQRFTIGILAVLVIFIAVLAFIPEVGGLNFYSATKVCQLTDGWDKERGKDTPNQALQKGVTGSDTGYPVPFMGQLLFFFGDTRIIGADTGSKEYQRASQGWDSVAIAPQHLDVEQSGCIVPFEFIENKEANPEAAQEYDLHQIGCFSDLPKEEVGKFRAVRLLQADPSPDCPDERHNLQSAGTHFPDHKNLRNSRFRVQQGEPVVCVLQPAPPVARLPARRRVRTVGFRRRGQP